MHYDVLCITLKIRVILFLPQSPPKVSPQVHGPARARVKLPSIEQSSTRPETQPVS